MRESLFLRVGLVTLLGLVCEWPGGARADEVLEAGRRRYEVGAKRFEEGRFLEAAQAFEEAYKLTPRTALLFNAARAYDKGGAAPRALELYEQFLRTTDSEKEQAEAKDRIEDLRRQVALVLVQANKSGAQVLIDGRDVGTTPLLQPVALGSGAHKVEVVLGDMRWQREQEFQVGLSHTVMAELRPPAPPPPPEEGARRNKRLAVVLGLGGVLDVAQQNFPPSQASVLFGADLRVMERPGLALDIAARIPLEVAQSWVNVAVMPGLRLVLTPSPRVPVEFVPSLDLGVSLLHITPGFTSTSRYIDTGCNQTLTCRLVNFRLHPALNVVWHFLPDWELRGEVFGVTVDLGSPLPDPRISFGLSVAWRFY